MGNQRGWENELEKRQVETERVNRQQLLEDKATVNSLTLPAAFTAFPQQLEKMFDQNICIIVFK